MSIHTEVPARSQPLLEDLVVRAATFEQLAAEAYTAAQAICAEELEQQLADGGLEQEEPWTQRWLDAAALQKETEEFWIDNGRMTKQAQKIIDKWEHTYSRIDKILNRWSNFSEAAQTELASQLVKNPSGIVEYRENIQLLRELQSATESSHPHEYPQLDIDQEVITSHFGSIAKGLHDGLFKASEHFTQAVEQLEEALAKAEKLSDYLERRHNDISRQCDELGIDAFA